MTNIEKIKQARQEMEAAFEVAFSRASRVKRNLRVRMIDMEVLQRSVHQLMALQAEALRQATEVADENFARAQRLSEQVQENVRHIERLAGDRGDVFTAVVDALEVLYDDYKALADSGDAGFWSLEDMDCGKQALAALALAKGEAV